MINEGGTDFDDMMEEDGEWATLDERHPTTMLRHAPLPPGRKDSR